MNQDVRSLSIIYEHMKRDKTIAKIVVINDGKVLLMQKPDSFEWELPGGHVEPGEKTKQAAGQKKNNTSTLRTPVWPVPQ